MFRYWTNGTCKHLMFASLENVFWGWFYENPPPFLSTSFPNVECCFRIWGVSACFKKHIWEVCTVQNTVSCSIFGYIEFIKSLFSAQYWIYSSLERPQQSLAAELITYATITTIWCFHCRRICSSLCLLKLNKYV